MIILSEYRKKLEGVEIQFRFVRWSLKSLSKAKKDHFFTETKNLLLSMHEKKWKSVEQVLANEKDVRDSLKEGWDRQLRRKLKEYNRANQYFYRQFSEDALNRSELLLIVAHFETFMKDIHAEFLRAKPNILAFSEPNRQLSREKIFSYGFEKLHKEEIAWEVERVDRKSIKDKAAYFHDKLDLSWGKNQPILLLTEIIDARNEISHELPEKCISDSFLASARELLINIPQKCVLKAHERYPDRFKL